MHTYFFSCMFLAGFSPGSCLGGSLLAEFSSPVFLLVFYLRFTLPMDRSPGFGSTPSNYGALFRLAFAA
ncbi:MAG: hypothetical protein R6V34_01445, partial [Bacteroidales bacterium]